MVQEDIITEQQAKVIARDYNFIPVDPLKCERVITLTPIRSIFFANTSNTIKVLIQFDRDEIDWDKEW